MAADMPPGPYLFPEDELSDLPNRMLVAEIVREQILRQTHEEVPHHATVETENWQERKDGSVRVDCTIYVGRATQKAILIGDGGAKVKAIGQSARRELEALLERRVHLFLNVKDRPGWDEERGRLRALGWKTWTEAERWRLTPGVSLPRAQEGQQVGVEAVLVGAGDAVRRALVDLQLGMLQQLRRGAAGARRSARSGRRRHGSPAPACRSASGPR